ncbi:MAG: GAF domain-containing protein [Spirulinaceae cyanobacterium RM2_2_10]|nr:GAF domain-containing protein [Spirulinaceae cyanobacterium RM2_2_10]
MLNRNLEVLCGRSQTAKLRAVLAYGDLNAVNPLPFTLAVRGRDVTFVGRVHRTDGIVVLELEPAAVPETVTFIEVHRLIKSAVDHIRRTTNLSELGAATTTAIRTLTGLERVMFYRFSEQGHGMVIAEDRQHYLEPMLGLNFPALDIPPTVRELFLQIDSRVIADTQAPAAELVPRLNPVTHKPLDLSHATLRGVSACHLEYLHNMGVGASMVIPLLKAGQLWGMIACHHSTPKHISYEIRAACELIGRVVSADLIAKDSSDDYEYQLEVNAAQTQLIAALALGDDVVTALTAHEAPLLDLVQAGGAALLIDDHCTSVGAVPAEATIRALVDWLHRHHGDEKVVYTDSLSQLSADYQADKAVASGMLALSLSETRSQYIFWFRPEVIQAVRWAGDPQAAIQKDSQGRIVLSPRQSFALWQESVRFSSLPWKACEVEAALALRQAILQLNLRRADKLAALNQALQASEVRERQKTEQLRQTLAELQATHTQLMQTHTQLVQSEKMSSLGQLVAGVAHEINNPVNFIYGNLIHAENYVRDLMRMLEVYAEQYPEPTDAVQDEVTAIELDFLLDDLPKLLGSMKLGTSRIREIVQSLRSFSRLDESEVKPVDLHEGLDSTLLILGNRLKDKSERAGIEVVKNYGDLPLVECYAGPLNQVFMNLLANAIDAVEESLEGRSRTDIKTNPGQITLTTRVDNQRQLACIAIADNGTGISEAARDRLFDPFFTTKPVGKGTGMGLAISFQIIVEKHGGHLRCESQPGAGTTFHIEIPLQTKSG